MSQLDEMRWRLHRVQLLEHHADLSVEAYLPRRREPSYSVWRINAWEKRVVEAHHQLGELEMPADEHTPAGAVPSRRMPGSSMRAPILSP